MPEDFVTWLNGKLNERSWSRVVAAERGGLSPSAYDKVIGGFAQPGPKFCRGVARAFGVPQEEVFRRAGLLPSAKVTDHSPVYHIGDNLGERLAVAFGRLGVGDVHPHRFRHTFAINYLRNGGDAYALQISLGHESLEMVRTYLALASADLVTVHQRASPVERWRL